MTLRYELRMQNGETVAVRLKPLLARPGLQRTLSIAPCSKTLWFLANSFAEGTAKRDVIVSSSVGTTVQVTSMPLSYAEPVVTEAGAETVYDTVTIETVAEQHWVRIPPHDTETIVTITTRHDREPNPRPPPPHPRWPNSARWAKRNTAVARAREIHITTSSTFPCPMSWSC